MSTEYRLSYTAAEIDERLGKIDNMVSSVNGVMPDANGNVEITIPDSGNNIDLSGYAQKSEIPTKVSQLQNDSGYLTEHQDITGKLDADKLPEAINTALAEAKASGEFNGDNGKNGVYVRNLLDNSDFRNPVMQGGFDRLHGTDYYVIDRWKRLYGIGTVTKTSDGIKIAGGTTECYINQKIDLTNLVDKTVTMAIQTNTGWKLCGSVVLQENTDMQVFASEMGLYLMTNGGGFTIRVIAGYEYTVQWVALYEGEYTFETLPEYQSRGYETELLICSQYDPTTGEYIGLKKFGSARNLLDNSDFTNPINQRGSQSYPVAEDPSERKKRFTIDRWNTGAMTALDIVSDGIVLTDHGYITIEQVIEANTSMCGKKFTGAVCIDDGIDDGKVIVCTGTFPVSTSSDVYQWCGQTETEDGLWVEMAKTPKDNNLLFKLTLYSSEGATLKLKWACVYEGEYTVETLPEYQPKGYAVEFVNCCRYAYAIGRYNMMSGFVTGSDKEVWTTVFSPVPIRLRDPSFESYPNVILRIVSGYSSLTPNTSSPITPTKMLCNSEKVENGQLFRIRFYFDSAIGANNTPATVFFDSGFVISADL